jgi:hypothetical protein
MSALKAIVRAHFRSQKRPSDVEGVVRPMVSAQARNTSVKWYILESHRSRVKRSLYPYRVVSETLMRTLLGLHVVSK